MTKRFHLTKREIESLLGAAGNVDPCMFDENSEATEWEKEKDKAALDTGMEKLRGMLAARRSQT